MKKIVSVSTMTALSALVLALPGVIAAQEPGETEEELAAAQERAEPEEQRMIGEEIEVVAPRIVRERLPLGRGERVSMSYRVNFDDLDLTQTADVQQLEERISQAAHEACEELASLYPQGDPEPSVCADQAINEAMGQAREAVAAAVE